jgi:hypothetical protein
MDEKAPPTGEKREGNTKKSMAWRRGMRVHRLLHWLLLMALVAHLLVSLVPLAAELHMMQREWPLLWGKSNIERLVLTLGGRMNSQFDYRFIAKCQNRIPEDAEVLVISDDLGDVRILNYYLHPRKTSIDAEFLGDRYWTVHYYTPAGLDMNSIKEPETNAQRN